MKLNISYPLTGCQQKIEIEDEAKLRVFYDKRLGAEIDGGALGDEFKGYILKVTGGVDKQGFPMKQGVWTNGRVRLLMSRGDKGFKGYGRRNGERRRKSVRGAILSPDLSVINLKIVRKGENELPGVTDAERPRLRGPKRATKIRKLFNLSKEDNLKRYVKAYSRKIEKNGKVYYKTPKIQRLITPRLIKRRQDKLKSIKKHRIKVREEAKGYHAVVMKRLKEAKERHSESVARKKEKMRASRASKEA